MYMRIIIALLLPLMLACSSESPSTETIAKIRPAILVKVGQVINKTFLSYPAVVEGQRGSELAFNVSGVVKELNVRAAQAVKKGQVLAKLDQRDFQSKYKSAQASYEHAEKEYQRALRLLKGDAISQSEVEKRKTTLDTAKAQLDTANKAFDDTVLMAPFSGNVAKVSIEALQTAQAGKPVIKLLNTKQLVAKINLPSHIIALSKKYKKTKNASFIAMEVDPDRRISAEFKEVSLEADAISQTYEMTLTFTPPDDLVILPGMNAVVWLKDPSKISSDQLISVPLKSIGTELDQKYVWVVDTDSMKISKRMVTVSEGVGINLDILSGLTPGETIVAAGISYLSEGMQVRRWSKK